MNRDLQSSILSAIWMLSGLALVAGCLAPQLLRADEPAAPTGKRWALLIGVEKYHRAPPLRYIQNDVNRLAAALQSRGDYASQRILRVLESDTNPRFQPLRASLIEEIPTWLGAIKEQDQVLVYFSGHGFQGEDGKLFLAPIDCKPEKPADTGVSVEWLRQQLAACKAATKVLILDACHAGSEKGEEDKGAKPVSADVLGEQFREVTNVVTLASSSRDEKSQLWEEREQSLFSYWLVQGLKGHADADGDQAVTIDELYDFVHRNVVHTARTRFPRAQTPVRIVRSGTPGVPVVNALRPVTLREVLSDTAEQLALAMEEHRLTSVGVLEFASDTEQGEVLGANYGLLGKYCAEEVERRLADLGRGKFSVIERERLKKATRQAGLGLQDLSAEGGLASFAQAAGGLPAVTRGLLTSRDGRKVVVRCKLLPTAGDGGFLGVAGGVAYLNENEWAMLGRSVRVLPEDRRPELPSGTAPPVAPADRIVDRLDERSRGPHPLLDPDFPFRVKIMIDGKERKGVFRGNDLFIPVRKGEVYQVWVENRSGQLALMRLLIDGLNAQVEREGTKGVETWVIGKRVNLDEASYWVLNPDDPLLRNKTKKEWAISGFTAKTGAEGKLREFLVVDAQESLAARRQFTDQIGLITAAFYSSGGGPRGVGTRPGEERSLDLREWQQHPIGNLIGVVHLHYVEEGAIPTGGR